MARLRTNSMNFYVELDERGVLIHNTLLLFPKNSHLVITRQLAKGKIVRKCMQCDDQGSVRIRTDSEDGWKEMRVDDSLFAYRFDMDLPCSRALFLCDILHSVSMPFSFHVVPQIRRAKSPRRVRSFASLSKTT